MLAASLLSRGGKLVADDRVHLSACHGRLIAAALGSAAGLLEMRGRGLLSMPYERSAVIRLVVDVIPEADLERFPADEGLSTTLLGLAVPRQAIPGDMQRGLLLVEAALSAGSGRRQIGLRSSPV